MSNKRITDLTELTTPTTDDVFPIVDIATNTTQKVQVGNLPIQTAVTTALATKQDTLVSGTNIKTVNSTSLVGSGNVAVQETLVSGTNIKTLNSVSLLGSGDIVLAATPSGVAGAIQFSDGSAFSSDATNFFWDDTNNRLGVGTNAPQTRVDIYANTAGTGQIRLGNIGTASAWQIGRDNVTTGRLAFISNGSEKVSFLDNFVGIGETAPTSRLQVKGSGSTSATTSLLVQNSSAVTMAQIKDNGEAYFNIDRTGNGFQIADGGAPTQQTVLYQKGGITQTTTRGSSSLKYFIWSSNASEFPNGHFGYNFDQFIISDVQKDLDAAKIASAVLQADSTTRGFLPPRMTTTQKNAIATPAAGLVVYDSTTNKLQCYNGSTWNDLF